MPCDVCPEVNTTGDWATLSTTSGRRREVRVLCPHCFAAVNDALLARELELERIGRHKAVSYAARKMHDEIETLNDNTTLCVPSHGFMFSVGKIQ